MHKTYKYQLSEQAYHALPGMDMFYYEIVHQYKEPIPNKKVTVWRDCNIDDPQNNRCYAYCIGRGWETRIVYRLKQI
jgi:hypothetical protein